MVSKKSSQKSTSKDQDNYWKIKQELNNKNIKLYDQVLFRDWCKACGICIAFCPKNVFGRDEAGRPVIEKPDDCIGCKFCELHCPDFAISIQERYPDRRRNKNGQ